VASSWFLFFSYNSNDYGECRYGECSYGEYRYGECRYDSVVMVSVVMVSVAMVPVVSSSWEKSQKEPRNCPFLKRIAKYKFVYSASYLLPSCHTWGRGSSLQPGHYSSLPATNPKLTANQERNDKCGNQHYSRELLMIGIVMSETC